MPIYVVRSGAFKVVQRAYRKQGNAFQEVLLAHRVQPSTPGAPQEFVKFYDRYLQPVTGLRGVTPGYSSGTMAWNASPQASGYQVLRRTTPTGPATILPAPDDWTSELSLNAVGLASNSHYYFTVRAHRFTPDGFELTSPESNQIHLYTGYPSSTVSGSKTAYINPYRTDTWTSAYNWTSGSGGPDVRQGEAPGTTHNTNGRGVVKYNYAYNELVSQWPSGVPYNMGYVVSAVVERIHRSNEGGGTTPLMNFYGCNVNFGDNSAPAAATSVGQIYAPVLGGDIWDVTFGGQLLGWARTWCSSPSPPYDGLLVFRTDGDSNKNGTNGYCILRNKDHLPNLWRVRLGLSWSYTVPGPAPTWS